MDNNRNTKDGVFQARPDQNSADKFVILIFGGLPPGAKPPQTVDDVPDGNADLMQGSIQTKAAGLMALAEYRKNSKSGAQFFLYGEEGLVAEDEPVAA